MPDILRLQPLLLLACIFFISPRQSLAVKRTKLTWVNGIAYTLQHMEEGKVDISKLFGGKHVDYCHNPTAMADDDDLIGYARDLSQAGTQKLGRITEEVNQLVKHLRNAIAQVGKNGKVIHIAHSQGALVTALAAKQLTPMEMSQIEVITFGGAAALRKTPQTPFHRVVNYYSVNDPLLLVVPAAAQALRSGLVADDEFCFLAPRIGDPIRDHNLLGPTYLQALSWEGQRFQRTYQSLVYRSSRSVAIFVVALLQLLSLRLHDFFIVLFRKTILPILQVAVLVRERMHIVVVQPVAALLVFFFLWIRQIMRQEQEQYQPVQVALDYASTKNDDAIAM